MHIVLCLDDRNGLLFNNRRLSSDVALYQRVYAQHSGRLLMNSYSAKLFAGMDVTIDNGFLEIAQDTDTCFVEDLAFVEYLPRVTSITIYRWNRHYPSDVKLSQQQLADWKLIAKTDFTGNSHETITEEKYIR